MTKKEFKIFKNEFNENWIKKNLDNKDYIIYSNIIVIYYYSEFQKTGILNEIDNYILLMLNTNY